MKKANSFEQPVFFCQKNKKSGAFKKMLFETSASFVVPYLLTSVVCFLHDCKYETVDKYSWFGWMDVCRTLCNLFVFLPLLNFMFSFYLNTTKGECAWYHPMIIPFYFAIQDVTFKLGHQLLHQNQFLQSFHHMHHRLVQPFGFAALYCHPVEFIFVNYFSVVAGLLVNQLVLGEIPIEIIFVWNTLTAISVVVTHSNHPKLDYSGHSVHHHGKQFQ